MKSPRFILREKEIKQVFAASRLRHTWRHKVRVKMRTHFLPDPIEHLDFHLALSVHCDQLEQLVCGGHYLPATAHRILMEKSKGLCRQIVIPDVRDALVLQCLSDALYDDIKGKAPSPQAFFEPEDHTFSNLRKSLLGQPRYGSFRAWLNFQQALFNFTGNKAYLVITDISNYYDFISYAHLRNIVASKIRIRESVLDMLIFILSGLLWQPDYAPRVEIGLPQMNIDAVRILAHCYLYELDEFLKDSGLDFARFMDDIDVGVNSVEDARRVLRDMDLVLHARQVRLNTGKTLILRNSDAAHHFRVRENLLLDKLVRCLDRKHEKAIPIDRERKHVRLALHRYYRKGRFDSGNGEKILNRLLMLSRRTNADVDIRLLNDVLRRRPAARSHAYGVIESRSLTPALATMVSDFIRCGIIVDELAYVEGANALVHCEAAARPHVSAAVLDLVSYLVHRGPFAVYAALWLLSKYGSVRDVYSVLEKTERIWVSDAWLGRLVGGLAPIFFETSKELGFTSLVRASKNSGAEEVMNFHRMLCTETKVVAGVRNIIRARNTSKRLGITHAKFLMLLSILRNAEVKEQQKAQYLSVHRRAWKDVFYRDRARSVLTSPALKSLVKV